MEVSFLGAKVPWYESSSYHCNAAAACCYAKIGPVSDAKEHIFRFHCFRNVL